MTPIEESCSMWQWLSTPPGSTSLPAASMVRLPLSPLPISAMRSPWIPTSARNVFSAVATVPRRITRSRAMRGFSYNFRVVLGREHGKNRTAAAHSATEAVLRPGRAALEADDGRERDRADGAREARHPACRAARRGPDHAGDARRPLRGARPVHALLG